MINTLEKTNKKFDSVYSDWLDVSYSYNKYGCIYLVFDGGYGLTQSITVESPSDWVEQFNETVIKYIESSDRYGNTIKKRLLDIQRVMIDDIRKII